MEKKKITKQNNEKIEGENRNKKKVIIDVILLIFLATPFLILTLNGNVEKTPNNSSKQSLTNSWQNVSPAFSSVNTSLAIAPSPITFIPTYPPSTWITYTNIKYHYSVKYPPDWKTAINGGGVFFVITSPDFTQKSKEANNGGSFVISVNPTNETSIESYYKVQDNTGPMSNINYKELVINGINAIQFDSVSLDNKLPLRNTEFIIGGNEYNFNAGLYTNQQTEEKYLIIYNQVLSSFKYIQ